LELRTRTYFGSDVDPIVTVFARWRIPLLWQFLMITIVPPIFLAEAFTAHTPTVLS
jgi:hypothetical protein